MMSMISESRNCTCCWKDIREPCLPFKPIPVLGSKNVPLEPSLPFKPIPVIGSKNVPHETRYSLCNNISKILHNATANK